MRKNIVAGNWKMNLTKTESVKLVDELSKGIENIDLKNNRVLVAPTYVNLDAVVSDTNRNPKIEVMAQNMHFADSGAYTGEISANMLLDINVKTVILGHSERREYFCEDDAILKKKVDQALKHKMEIVFCFGEKLEDRKIKNHFNVVEKQLKNALFHVKNEDWKNIILAYEPVWAIGTGMTASPEQAQEMHAFIRNLVKENFNTEIAANVSILYGGSVKPTNAKEIFSKPDVDGGLIGGAALKAEMFLDIIKAM
jgi:triosephosphate isomerase